MPQRIRMASDRWERVAELYHAASLRPPAERQQFLAEACRADEELRREVQSLLDQPVSHDGLLERVASQIRGLQNGISVDESADSSTAAPPLPAAIGRYRILRLVGQGGMGAVYEAAQDHPRRVVALKVMKPGL